jgi:hypothetical protein
MMNGNNAEVPRKTYAWSVPTVAYESITPTIPKKTGTHSFSFGKSFRKKKQ